MCTANMQKLRNINLVKDKLIPQKTLRDRESEMPLNDK